MPVTYDVDDIRILDIVLHILWILSILLTMTDFMFYKS